MMNAGGVFAFVLVHISGDINNCFNNCARPRSFLKLAQAITYVIFRADKIHVLASHSFVNQKIMRAKTEESANAFDVVSNSVSAMISGL